MLYTSKLSVLALTVAMVACSTDKSDTSTESPAKISEEDAKAQGAKLPAVAIMKVPVGADGKELNDQAEMRLVSNEGSLNEQNIEETFSSASAPVSVIDEMDQTTSTESFCGWHNWGRRSRMVVVQSQPVWNWTFYRPTYLNYGYNYGYNYGGAYSVRCGQQVAIGCGQQIGCRPPTGCGHGQGLVQGQVSSGYNYYYYNRSFNQTGYSGTGWNPSVSYNPNGGFGNQQPGQFPTQPGYGEPGQLGGPGQGAGQGQVGY